MNDATLRAALERWLYRHFEDGGTRDISDETIESLRDLVVAYGDRQEAAGAERGLRDAAPALACEDDYARLMARADEIRGRQT